MEGKLCERLYVSCKYDTMRIFLPNMIHCSNKKKISQTIPASILITRAQQLPHLLNCKTSLEKSDGWLAAIKIKKFGHTCLKSSEKFNDGEDLFVIS